MKRKDSGRWSVCLRLILLLSSFSITSVCVYRGGECACVSVGDVLGIPDEFADLQVNTM